MLSSKNRKHATISIFISLIFIFIYYIINFAYNKTQHTPFETVSSVNCIIDICINYDNIKECIHIGTPTLFKVEINTDNKYGNSSVKNVEYTTIKEGCK